MCLLITLRIFVQDIQINDYNFNIPVLITFLDYIYRIVFKMNKNIKYS